MDDTVDVAVVGAGISGLTFAYHAARAGARCLVLEATALAGGCIHTARTAGGFWFELGAHTLYNSYGALLDVVTGLGLDATITSRRKAPYRLLVDGKLRSVPSELALGELFASVWRAFTLRKEGRTVGDYYGRLVGERNWRRVVSPLLAAVPSQRADAFPAEMLFKKRARRTDLPRSFTLRDGLSTLIARLAGQERVTVRTGATVATLARAEHGFTLACADGTGVRARAVALAVPPDRARPLLEPVLPAAATALARIDTTAIDSTGVVFAKTALPLPRIAGLVPLDDDFFSAVSRDVVPDEHHRALAFHFRSGLAPAERSERIARVTGVDPGAFLHLAEHRSVLPSPTLGHTEIVRDLDASLPRSGVYMTGNYFGGLALEDCVLRSRAEAARRLAEQR